jgi:hypothetical protein
MIIITKELTWFLIANFLLLALGGLMASEHGFTIFFSGSYQSTNSQLLLSSPSLH